MTNGKSPQVWIVCDYCLRCLPEDQFAQVDTGGYVCRECAQDLIVSERYRVLDAIPGARDESTQAAHSKHTGGKHVR